MRITVPASTSNLGASFDTCGLALSLHLRVTIEGRAERFEITASGEGEGAIPRDETNLIARVARFVADNRGRRIDGARLRVENQIPMARGLGSSSAAIMAGISIYEAMSGQRLSQEEIFEYALHFEEHGDNLAPSLLGGLVVACVVEEGEKRSLVTLKRAWPEQVKIVLAVPDFEMETAKMRAVLPESVPRQDAIYNLQRAALLQAALSEHRFDLISEALSDRLHQPFRAPLGKGLADVLRLNDETASYPGLLGVALSGAGSTVIAFVIEGSLNIAGEMKRRFAASGVNARTMEASVNNRGRTVE
jgi:homoserine kinase